MKRSRYERTPLFAIHTHGLYLSIIGAWNKKYWKQRAEQKRLSKSTESDFITLLMISKKYKCIYVHIPKCAGTSIDFALSGKYLVKFDKKRGIWIQHATAQQIKEYYASKKQWNNYFRFAIARNPFDRVASSYNWLCYNKKIPISKSNFRDFVLKKGIFKELLDPKASFKKENRYHQVMPAVDYLFENGNLSVDFVGRFENLERDWKFICEKLNTKIDLPHLYNLDHKPYQDYYDEETKKIVSETYEEDLKIFGYEF